MYYFDQNYTNQQIRKVFAALSKIYHPSALDAIGASADLFQKLKAEYDFLEGRRPDPYPANNSPPIFSSGPYAGQRVKDCANLFYLYEQLTFYQQGDLRMRQAIFFRIQELEDF